MAVSQSNMGQLSVQSYGTWGLVSDDLVKVEAIQALHMYMYDVVLKTKQIPGIYHAIRSRNRARTQAPYLA
jgi:hypothetical protein